MAYQNCNRVKRIRRSTSGSYHSAVEDSDYENDVGEELEEEEEELLVPKKTYSDDPQISRHNKRPFFTIAFLSGIIFALGTVFVVENIKNGFYRSQPSHFELLPHLNIRDGISNFVTEENWTKTQLVKKKDNSVTRSSTTSSEGKYLGALCLLWSHLIWVI